jgi:hypothetical protein
MEEERKLREEWERRRRERQGAPEQQQEQPRPQQQRGPDDPSRHDRHRARKQRKQEEEEKRKEEAVTQIAAKCTFATISRNFEGLDSRYWCPVIQRVIQTGTKRKRLWLVLHPDKQQPADRVLAEAIFKVVYPCLTEEGAAKGGAGKGQGQGQKGIDAATGKLKKGFRYSGARDQDGRPVVVASGP